MAESASAISGSALRSRLASTMRSASPYSSVAVRDLGSGSSLFSYKGTTGRAPASVEKLYTTSTALDKFGPSGKLKTEVLADGTVDAEGVLDGDVYLRGGGDPTFSSTSITNLARIVDTAGISLVKGRVYGDESLFDDRYGTIFTNFRPTGETGVLSALSYNRGYKGSSLTLAPAYYSSQRLRAALIDTGIKVRGRASAQKVPETAKLIGSQPSPSIETLAKWTNQPSDNFYAEMLLKGVGAKFGGAGSTKAGAAIAMGFARASGATPKITDGSGLSLQNKTSAESMVKLLSGVSKNRKIAGSFDRSLAIVGQNGTLSGRMRGTAAQGRCHAKTGTHDAVASLAGYCSTTGGRNVAFAILINATNVANGRAVIDRMVPQIATYSG